MKRSLILLVLLFFLLCNKAHGKYDGGNGEPSNPFLIATPENLNAIGTDPNDWDKYFLMTADINMAAYIGTEFNIIGNSDNPFTGVFDGNNRTIMNFTYDSTGEGRIGIFGYINSSEAIIQNLNLINPAITGSFSTGGLLAGYLNSGTIKNCKVTGGSVSGYDYLGGLVGYTSTGGEVKDCNVACSITGQSNLGGIVGKNDGMIKSCHFDGDVSGRIDIGGITGMNVEYIDMCSSGGTITVVYDPGSHYYAGGIAGENRSGTIRYSNSSAYITGSEWMGGLVGYNYQSVIEECYATGNVSGSNRLGGLVGSNSSGIVRNCYATGSVSGNAAVGGLIGDNSAYNSTHVIEHCYSVGYVSGVSNVGGLIGYDDGHHGNFLQCFWNQTINPTLGGIGNGFDSDVIGETTANMKLKTTYESVGWNFVTPIWTIEDGVNYPELWWEILSGGYGGGTGTPEDPFLIYTPEQLNTIARDFSNLDKHFKLMADIDLSQYSDDQFNIIGDQINPFTGVFDGNNHTITNFTYITPLIGYVGLFGYLEGQQSRIKNLILLEPEVRTITTTISGWGIAAVVGQNSYGSIENCHVIGGNVHGINCVGGLTGASTSGDIYNCSSSCNVSGSSSIGVLIGGYSYGIISRCHATGSVSGEHRIGGLIGDSYAELVTECWADCHVSGLSTCGGLIGENNGSVNKCFAKGQVSVSSSHIGGLTGHNIGSIKNCYSSTVVSGGSYAGGFCGLNDGQIENSYSTGPVTGSESSVRGFGIGKTSYYCFWDVNTSGNGISGDDNNGAIGKTTEEMKSLQTFLMWGCDIAWNIDDGNDYPHLIWENMSGEIITKPAYGGGSGELNDPYLIYNAEQLRIIGMVPCDAKKHFKLMSDINMETITPNHFMPIGNNIQPFQGVFDGNGHIINNFQLVAEGGSQFEGFGLFGYINDPNAHIKNIHMYNPNVHVISGNTATGALIGIIREGSVSNCTIENANVQGRSNVGILAGYSFYQTFSSATDCNVTGTVLGLNSVGGLVGCWDNGILTNCHAIASVSGNSYIGALAGYASCTLSGCSAKGQVNSTGEQVGGLAGYLSGNCSYSWADCNVISAGDSVGGLAGFNRATITNCYSKGTVSGNDKVGGFLGENTGGSISGCYSKVFVTGSDSVGGFIGDNQSSVMQSWVEADVDGYQRVGGFIGRNTSQISQCYAESTVQGYSYVGGFVGGNFSNSYTLLKNCYADGTITGTEIVGGFVGYNDNPILYSYSISQIKASNDVGGFAGDSPGPIIACYWDTQTSGLTNSSGGVGKPTYMMKQSDTYVDWGSQGTWIIDEAIDYPRLLWQQMPGNEIIDRKYFTGDGTTQSPYLIANVQQFNTIGLAPSIWDKHFMLISDIDFIGINGSNYNVIGKNKLPFTGTFDGKGHTISNFSYEHPSEKHVGIFGYVSDSNAIIKNILMVNVDINDPAGFYIGPLVGYLQSGTISNCHVKNAYISGSTAVGGLSGGINGYVENCTSKATVSGFQSIGGFTGFVDLGGHVIRCSTDSNVGVYFPGGGFVGDCRGIIEQSFSSGSVQGYMWIGGFSGYSNGTILNCFTDSSATGQKRVGGLVGYTSSQYNISNCYSYGLVYGDQEVGGLIGYGGSQVSDCFWDVNTSGTDISSGGTGLTTVEMKSYSTYFNAGWDFNDIWSICDCNNYPKLLWMIPPYDYLCPDGVDFIDYSYLAMHWMETDYGDVNGIELTGDGIVNYHDFAVFANWWNAVNCGQCGGADYTGDGNVNWEDLEILCLNWLVAEYGDCSGAEITQDGVVDWRDLMLFCENWLESTKPMNH